MLWFWLLAAPAILLAILALRGERARAEYVCRRLAEQRENRWTPPATVIVPVKGEDEGLRENLAALASLDYPDYELIVAARTAEDIPPGVLPPSARIVLSAAEESATGEKIQNLLAAVSAARPSSTVFAFADSDGRPGKDWLRALVAPLQEHGVGAVTGYRWYVPEPPDFWSLVRSVWNAAIAGNFGPGPNWFAWGGAMAIQKETFLAADVPSFWQGAVSDDYRLTHAVKQAGLMVAYAPGATVACPDHTSAREFFAWARRQLTISRTHGPELWYRAMAGHVIYCGGMLAAIVAALSGSHLGEWALVAQLALGMLKGANRSTLAKACLPEWETWFKRYAWVYTWWAPLATWIWLITLISSATSNRIVWRGRRYDLKRYNQPRKSRKS
ncbi:MAG: glycosyltransferase family 2 protein [Bryobacteraceae bacterium]